MMMVMKAIMVKMFNIAIVAVAMVTIMIMMLSVSCILHMYHISCILYMYILQHNSGELCCDMYVGRGLVSCIIEIIFIEIVKI